MVKDYQHSEEPSLRALAKKYGVAYFTLSGRLKGRQTREAGHRRMQVLSKYEEKWVVRWCARQDEWGHPARLAVVKSMAEDIIPRREKDRSLGKYWITRFLSRHPDLAARLSSKLDRQRALASNPSVIKDHFSKVRLDNFFKCIPR